MHLGVGLATPHLETIFEELDSLVLATVAAIALDDVLGLAVGEMRIECHGDDL